MSTNLLALHPSKLEAMVLKWGWPRFRAQQILRWLYRDRARTVSAMTNLSQAERAYLEKRAHVGRAEVCETVTAGDGTKKLLSRLEDGLVVESVLIPDASRLTLCLSTQVGCTLDCTFCLTATMGLKRNLRAHEIVDQVLAAQDTLATRQRLSNVVLMGMGEPLANLDALTDAVTRITDARWGVGIPPRRITISTAGLASRLAEAAALGVNLAISLNATTDEIRDRIMPSVNRLFPLHALLGACRALALHPRQRLTFEYVLLAGENDSDEDAKRLAKLLAGMRCRVNLIPFNEYPGSSFRRPSDAVVLAFQAVLRRAGLDTFIRKSKGRDVLGACGQLGEVTHPSASLSPSAATPTEAYA